jgi:hypothetical protein
VTPKNLRLLIKDEVRSFLEDRPKALRDLFRVVAEQLAPAIETEIARGLLTTTGQLKPTERDRVIAALDEAVDWITKYGAVRPKDIDDSDVVVSEMNRLIVELRTPEPKRNGGFPEGLSEPQGGGQ